MKNTDFHCLIVEKIALGLGELNEKTAFVGGAVVGLYADDPAADDVRPTMDIDITLQITTLGQLEGLRELLSAKGFRQFAEDDVVCRFRYEGILVDVMSTKPVGWAPANPWFAPGFEQLILKQVGSTTVRLLSLPYFLATKFDAHHDRGSTDPRTSKDFEDIVYLLDNVSDLVQQVLAAPEGVRNYLIAEFAAVLNDPASREAVLAQLPYLIQAERFEIILNKIRNIVAPNR
jgi:hypothetical protein